MRTFTRGKGKAGIFWTIERQGATLTTTTGKPGNKGRATTRTLPDDREARLAYNKAVVAKLREGYAETTPRPGLPPLGPEGEALEKALLSAPDDLSAHMAYADWLSEQPDRRLQARGELIQVQLALESEGTAPAQRAKLQRRERALLKAHQRDYLGDLASFYLDGRCEELFELEGTDLWPPGEFALARGWLTSLRARFMTEALAHALARSPEARLLRELVVENTPYTERAFCILGASPYLGNLRRLEVVNEGKGIEALLKVLPRLEELRVEGFHNTAGNAFAFRSLGRLRSLVVENADDYPLEDLAENPSVGRLRHVELRPRLLSGSWVRNLGASIKLEGVRALVKSKHLSALTHLVLTRSDLGDEGCREIVRTGALKRLKVLDLSEGCVTDDGARVLARCPDLRNLERLDLSGNRLTPAGVRALRATGVKLTAEEQQAPDDDGEYGNEYLIDDDLEDEEWE